MGTTNWPRLLLCGLITGFVWTLLSATLLGLVGQDFVAAVPGRRLDAPGGLHLLMLGLNFAQAIWGIWFYTVLRPRYGPGKKTAALAGFAWWVVVSLQSAKWAALVAVPVKAAGALLLTTLPAIIVAMAVGAWAYERQKSGKLEG